jgi:hypothetical protein
MLYVPLGVLAATVIPLASMLNGPVVNGVTLVLVVVAAMLLNVSFVNARSMPLQPYCLMQQLPMDRLLHRPDCLLACSGITICWAYIQSC